MPQQRRHLRKSSRQPSSPRPRRPTRHFSVLAIGQVVLILTICVAYLLGRERSHDLMQLCIGALFGSVLSKFSS